MKKRVISLLMVICLAVCLLPSAALADYTPQYTDYADTLFGLELFQGTGINPDGTPNYRLDRAPTRAESLVMLLRLFGEENAALSSAYSDPFIDSDHWAQKYISYAYNKGYTTGTTSTKFEPETYASANMYLTFLLRALGYDDKAGDFSYSTAYIKAAELGICPEGAYTNDSVFYRDDCVYTSYNALNTKMKGSDDTLLDYLVEKGAVEADKAELCRLAGDPTKTDNLLDLSVFYNVGLSLSQLRNLFPRGYYSAPYGFTTSSFVADKFGQITFAFDDGIEWPSTGAEGKLRQIMPDSSVPYTAETLAAEIGGTIYDDCIVVKWGGSTLTIYENNNTYDSESLFVYVNEPFEKPIVEQVNLIGSWMAETNYEIVGFVFDKQDGKTVVAKIMDCSQKGGTRYVSHSNVTFTTEDYVTYVSNIITDSYNWKWQFTFTVDVSAGYAKLNCSVECIDSNTSLWPGYTFPDQFQLTWFS